MTRSTGQVQIRLFVRRRLTKLCVGVIGEYPILKPGSFHKYCSRTSFEVERGEMGGFFTYRKLHKNRSFLLHTPKFTLQVPPMIEDEDD